MIILYSSSDVLKFFNQGSNIDSLGNALWHGYLHTVEPEDPRAIESAFKVILQDIDHWQAFRGFSEALSVYKPDFNSLQSD